eukprot:gnl/Spiro4/3962_TR1973_c0_g2_i1.p1 gnl/Spiro4/3962_TR1973_c0_g2~~gnl/Spiro4/3962_TR1973_c0_g2_i1.p1  ORF type:complete len:532 (-),score=96.42 gnl/Spiro4/3962_TR1973_c0_g2_i1:100-1581(-)
MGAVDSIPVVSQLKSLVQVSFGDAEGARNTQITFSRRCPIVSQSRSLAELIMGRPDHARATQIEFVHGLSDAADTVPVVGHIKGGIHYACGDKSGGDAAMKSSSRSTMVLAAGVGGFAVGGPVGASFAGAAGGALMDGITTAADSAVHKEYRPQGIVHMVETLKQNPRNPGLWFDAAILPIADGTAGYAAGRLATGSMARPSAALARAARVCGAGVISAKDKSHAGPRVFAVTFVRPTSPQALCISCMEQEQTTIFRHGTTGHQLFCSDCTSTYLAKKRETNAQLVCPCCNQVVDDVVQLDRSRINLCTGGRPVTSLDDCSTHHLVPPPPSSSSSSSPPPPHATNNIVHMAPPTTTATPEITTAAAPDRLCSSSRKNSASSLGGSNNSSTTATTADGRIRPNETTLENVTSFEIVESDEWFLLNDTVANETDNSADYQFACLHSDGSPAHAICCEDCARELCGPASTCADLECPVCARHVNRVVRVYAAKSGL